MGRFFLLVGGFFGVWAIAAWDLMLFVGIAHDAWWKFVPIMGYGTAWALSAPGMLVLIIVFAVSFIGEVIRG
jgi:hypothetical protein